MYASSRHRSSPRAGPAGSGGPARRHNPAAQTQTQRRAAASDDDDEFLSASELVRSLQPVPQPPQARPPYSSGGRPMGFSDERMAPDGPPRQQQQSRGGRGRPADAWLPLDATQANLGFSEWPFDAEDEGGRPPPTLNAHLGGRHPKALRSRGSAGRMREEPFEPEPMDPNDDYEAARVRAYQVMYEQQRQAQLHSQTARMQRYQYQRAMQREFAPPPQQQQQQFRGRGVHPFDPPRRIPRTMASPASAAAATSTPSPSALASFALRPNGMRRDGMYASSASSMTLDPSPMDMYAPEMDSLPPSSRRPRVQQQVQGRRVARGGHEEDAHVDARRAELAPSRPRKQHGNDQNQDDDARASFSAQMPPSLQEDAGGHPAAARRAEDASDDMDDLPLSSSVPSSRRRPAPSPARPSQAKGKRPRTKTSAAAEPKAGKAKAGGGKKPAKAAETGAEEQPEPKRRCGRKSMNYSSEQKRERNRAAVKKCRQRRLG
ncbi:hypothetical protein BBJ28_00020028, partial [Nothophytophthora sp. Chile5]